jgi:hypothetical protein
MGTNDLTGEVIGAAIEVHKELGESMGHRVKRHPPTPRLRRGKEVGDQRTERNQRSEVRRQGRLIRELEN